MKNSILLILLASMVQMCIPAATNNQKEKIASLTREIENKLSTISNKEEKKKLIELLGKINQYNSSKNKLASLQNIKQRLNNISQNYYEGDQKDEDEDKEQGANKHEEDSADEEESQQEEPTQQDGLEVIHNNNSESETDNQNETEIITEIKNENEIKKEEISNHKNEVATIPLDAEDKEFLKGISKCFSAIETAFILSQHSFQSPTTFIQVNMNNVNDLENIITKMIHLAKLKSNFLDSSNLSLKSLGFLSRFAFQIFFYSKGTTRKKLVSIIDKYHLTPLTTNPALAPDALLAQGWLDNQKGIN